MYRAFRLNLADIQPVVTSFKLYGLKQSNEMKEKLSSGLSSYMNVSGSLNGQKIIDDWFRQVDVDIFISHSHRNLEEVHALAGWLYKNFGLTSFIDSDIWGYCDDLIKEMDKIYCLKPDGNYDYSSRNETTSHVHVMLMSALSKMIDKTECLFFLDSDQSITVRDSVLKTNSPWIYNELLISSMVRRKDIKRPSVRIHDSSLICEQREYAATEMLIEYPAVYKHMQLITRPDLKDWLGLCKRFGNQVKTSYQKFPLDMLYALKEEKYVQ